MNNILTDIYKFLINNSSIIVFDDYAYNIIKIKVK